MSPLTHRILELWGTSMRDCCFMGKQIQNQKDRCTEGCNLLSHMPQPFFTHKPLSHVNPAFTEYLPHARLSARPLLGPGNTCQAFLKHSMYWSHLILTMILYSVYYYHPYFYRRQHGGIGSIRSLPDVTRPPGQSDGNPGSLMPKYWIGQKVHSDSSRR